MHCRSLQILLLFLLQKLGVPPQSLRFAPRLARLNSRGSTAVEFALIAPVLLMMMMGITEVSLIMYAQSIMEGATFSASRLGKTGYVAQGVSREATILDALQHRADALFDMSHVAITTTTYNQFDQIGQPEPFVDANGNSVRDADENYTDVNGNGQYDTDMGVAGMGNASQIVVYTVNYPWPIFTPLIGEFIGTDGAITLSARAVVQNEPF